MAKYYMLRQILREEENMKLMENPYITEVSNRFSYHQMRRLIEALSGK